MTEYRYRAYISYSHADERWAAWLQRALEAFRVPTRLTAHTGAESLPRRIAPVFRDREDLSSAHSLSESLLAALHASEALIVVCSPAAAASRWVNEEVRQFQALGRANRVFCMIVDGDPAAPLGEGGCFPPALFDGAQDADAEPLAADPRDFADGKRLAKLKLIAGLLGVRLDQLRQRDLLRRRRWLALGVVATAAAIALAALAITARIAQRQEQAQAEQLASFIVDLGEDLQSELDLESLSRISTRAMAYLENLDPLKLSPETGIRVGLALRQVGLVNQRQGKADEALDALQRSRQIFENLSRKYPQNDDARFELSQAEFYVGNYYYEAGDLASARAPWSRYHDIALAEYTARPSDRRWLLELSYGSLNMVLLRILSDQPVDQSLLDDVAEMIRLAAESLAAWPDDSEVLSHYSNALAWAADAQYHACRLEAARRFRQLTLENAQQAAEADPSNKVLRRRVAYRYTGLAMVLESQGNLAEAERDRRASLEILLALVAMDPSDQELARGIAANQRLLASLLRETGQNDAAMDLMQQAAPVLLIDSIRDAASDMQLVEYARFLLDKAELLRSSGKLDAAGKTLDQLLGLFLTGSLRQMAIRDQQDLAAQFRYQWWLLHGQDPLADFPVLDTPPHEASSPFRSCNDAEFSAKLAVVRGDQEAAQAQVGYLAERGYRHPEYLRFCREQGLCPP